MTCADQLNINDLLALPPFGMDAASKRELFTVAMSDLTRHHYTRSVEFRRIAGLFRYDPLKKVSVEEMPFVPARLFKEFELRSVDVTDVTRTMTSSGTSGQAVSRVFLDRSTAANQTKVLVKIVSSFTGAKRLPFLVVDSPAVLRDRSLFSARGAGILGFGMVGYDPTYMLTEDYEIDFARLDSFLERHSGQRVLLFGFTFLVWEHLCLALERAGRRLDLQGILIHGGGWKKLSCLQVDQETFKSRVANVCGISDVHNYYGMAEQAGSIFMECSEGVLHASLFSDVIVRDPVTFRCLGIGNAGLLQVISLLPTSYPGHSVLTEDLGEILGVDDCPCGRMGSYFRVSGRIEKAEVRGCSDVYASQ
jgi:hypothetical protein